MIGGLRENLKRETRKRNREDTFGVVWCGAVGVSRVTLSNVRRWW